MVCECENGKSFIFDADDYDKIKEYYWNFDKSGSVQTYINRKQVSLSKFILDLERDPNKKVLHKNGDRNDFRKINLYSGNTYTEQDNYYIGYCFNDEQFLIDKDDYGKLNKYVWHVDKNGYVITKDNGCVYKQHRMILGLSKDDAIEVDHINHNKLDNRKNNLRLVNRSQQCMNSKKKGNNNTCPIKGVYKMSGYDKWCAQINANGKRIYLGSYDSIEEAKKVRNAAANKLHGEYQYECE